LGVYPIAFWPMASGLIDTQQRPGATATPSFAYA
jgi:hypothetical protein